ncbi:similar to Saccharomyces cerevisiae YFR018C Putative protein of unknown function [Maudiozyma barnettii]|uniref:Peptide hydrolase n=1 Tax=Maudiozyma barnettii TaxID=61262 RepID=A0A8H2VFI5_9SACH|nr:hypothetical protein [Kazachstania barnettii]CAB4254530.1 similar to Saccharomyces cerevisiae YFR018C Putative protein of unknown function [Kazachstania barnettii]CAD1782571.1 similar to Saccharomyces cerevisiae YFR018C Putative protein of unknown function [Kazachstania barnettii]
MPLTRRKLHTLVFLIIAIFFNVKIVQGDFIDYHNEHLSKQLSLIEDSKDNLLLPFNITRTPGSGNSFIIQQFISNHFQTKMQNNWIIEYDNFQENDYNFTNMIFTLDMDNNEQDDKKYILFAAHYDTLVNIDGFIGAVDSAASCSILMYLSQFLDDLVYEDQYLIDKILEDKQYGIKIVFFDGEEALHEWTETDSIYGSRHLANKWIKDETMSQIELFVLLDLIGGKRTNKVPEWQIKSYYKTSHKYYKLLSEIEDSYLESEQNTFFTQKELHPTDVLYLMINKILIEDDHVPFYNANVPILHLIPFPFPESWHTVDDKFDTLDENEIQRWAIILSEFAVEALSG